ncbi:hypothetical protein EG346_16020 [Chryseobacterium carnipullorum]|uniref:Uncharacterized protein n=1 Tax=Chryseobacterium carnipullorum TaxID=1124835 RepID=A0A376DU90_CHRCU|nr:hypothetical protein [Chryseobacterium carnipullorum]AZA49593.1 hypothetical protein EG346_16020 [Chryseobacterium carnipullorum]AZA64489.1 hypothetical protein EG345_07035 [Chryseobacterium carnipullorum]STC94918.1 Uncharacterised protein [Chryseobacterium carnipullorum]
MEIKFYTNKGILDLSNVKFSTQEQNSMMSDRVFTKFFFPFVINVDDLFFQTFGDYLSDESKDVEVIIEGHLFHENKTYKAALTIENVEGYVLTGQIDYGFEEIPNFDKKLSELPYEKFKVDDIYSFAEGIVLKKWPQTNYNFPRIFTKKFVSDDIWDSFDGYYNDSTVENSLPKMKRNYIDGSGNIFNVNIIHPCPHPIYLLKVGFRDAGFDLLGDVLSDPDLQQRWVFSGTDYFTMKSQTRLEAKATQMDYYEDEPANLLINGHTYKMRKRKYSRSFSNLLPGNYKIKGSFRIQSFYGKIICRITANNTVVWEHDVYYTQGFLDKVFPIDISVPLNLTSNGINFFVEYIPLNYDASDYDVISFRLTSDVLTDDNASEEDTKVVNNLNEIDLSRAVPEMTFGDYVNGIKNWFNYDMDVVGTKIYMNRLGKNEPSNVQDFNEFSIKSPKKTFLQKRSFLIKFPDLPSPYKLDSIYYDYKGVKLNGLKNENTTEVEINGYPLPVAKPKEISAPTAIDALESSDVIGLVFYDGLIDGQNNSKNVPGCSHPELFNKNFLQWLRQRTRGVQYQWQKEVNAESFSQVKIKNHIFCNNNVHLIVSLNKDKVGDNTYQIDIVTETIS